MFIRRNKFEPDQTLEYGLEQGSQVRLKTSLWFVLPNIEPPYIMVWFRFDYLTGPD